MVESEIILNSLKRNTKAHLVDLNMKTYCENNIKHRSNFSNMWNLTFQQNDSQKEVLDTVDHIKFLRTLIHIFK